MYTFSKDDVIGERCDTLITKIRSQLKELQILGENQPSLRKRFRSVDQSAQKSIGLLIEAKESIDEGGHKLGTMRSLEKRQRVQECTKDTVEQLADYSEEAVRLEKYEPKKIAEIRKQISILLLSALIFSIAMAVYIAQFFSRDISRRLMTIRDNATRFSQGTELFPPVSGQDEIKELDSTLLSSRQQRCSARVRTGSIHL